MMKKGHKRKNWTERWFLLRPNSISYYVSEDLAEKKGDIMLDGNCCVEASDIFQNEPIVLHYGWLVTQESPYFNCTLYLIW